MFNFFRNGSVAPAFASIDSYGFYYFIQEYPFYKGLDHESHRVDTCVNHLNRRERNI
jgi:hypothetical protein